MRFVFSEGGGKRHAVAAFVDDLRGRVKTVVDYSLSFRRYLGGPGSGGLGGDEELLAAKVCALYNSCIHVSM